jgi:adenosylcobinamide-GDP ribazoletransferase
VACVLSVVVLVLATGGLHLDGVSDCADGLAVNGNAAKRLAAMHDPRAGAAGVTAVVLWTLLKVALLIRCVEQGTVAQAMWCALVFARTPIAFELREGEPATPGKGLFAWLQPEMRRDDWVISLLFGAAFLVPAIAPMGEIALRCGLGAAAGLAVTVAWHLGWYRRVGGLTGDVLGAAIEIREVVMLAAMGATLPL